MAFVVTSCAGVTLHARSANVSPKPILAILIRIVCIVFYPHRASALGPAEPPFRPKSFAPQFSQSKCFSYLPAPEAPFETASRNCVTVSPPLAWLGGYSLKVSRNWLTITVAGTIVHSLSPHHLP